jgi:hypothetical protein
MLRGSAVACLFTKKGKSKSFHIKTNAIEKMNANDICLRSCASEEAHHLLSLPNLVTRLENTVSQSLHIQSAKPLAYGGTSICRGGR